MFRNLMVLAVILASAEVPANAFTLDGEILASSGDGDFIKLEPDASLVVGNDTVQNNNLYAFDEDQNIVLEQDLPVDIGPEGTVIPAGTTVASHYVFFDPRFGQFQHGAVEFDATVLGIATSQWTLSASDFLANTEVTYLNPGLRGLEWGDTVRIDPDNPFRIIITWSASTPGDYIRVFTAASPSVFNLQQYPPAKDQASPG